MTQAKTRAFTLIELLIVISIIMLLTAILLPTLRGAKELARSAQCQANLHDLAGAMGIYHAENNYTFWPYFPRKGVRAYFWGTDADPVDPNTSPLLRYCNYKMAYLWCPDLPWGSYIPQGMVSEPTTTYGYNAYYLDPNQLVGGRSCRKVSSIPRPAEVFVLADAAMSWMPDDVLIFQNSTYLEPVWNPDPWWVQTPTNAFRHRGATNALCGDGHTGNFTPEGWTLDPTTNLGFVGTGNYPHYEQ